MSKTKIEWTEYTVNPFPGCKKCSPGCLNCYAERMAKRLKAMGQAKYENVIDAKGWTGKIFRDHGAMHVPGAGKMVFVNSMGDLAYEGVGQDEFDVAAEWMRLQWQHTFQVLTKRPAQLAARLAAYRQQFPPDKVNLDLHNVWLGVTVCNQQEADEKIPILLQIRAAVRFVSFEPLLEAIDLSPWIGYNAPIQKGECNNAGTEQRADSVRGGGAGRVRNRQPRQSLADNAPHRVALDAQGQTDTLSATTSRARLGSVLPNPSYGRTEKDVLLGASSGLVSLQWPNTARNDGESQERPEKGQPTTESRTGDVFRTSHSCVTDPQSGSNRPAQNQERNGKTDRCGSRRDFGCKGEDSCGNQNTARTDNLRTRKEAQGVISDRLGCNSRPKLDLVIVGPETGPGARPCKVEWIDSIVSQCEAAGVPVFVKAVPYQGKVTHDINIISSLLGRPPEALRQRPERSGK